MIKKNFVLLKIIKIPCALQNPTSQLYIKPQLKIKNKQGWDQFIKTYFPKKRVIEIPRSAIDMKKTILFMVDCSFLTKRKETIIATEPIKESAVQTRRPTSAVSVLLSMLIIFKEDEWRLGLSLNENCKEILIRVDERAELENLSVVV